MRIAILVAAGGLLSLTFGCGNKFSPSDYFPVKKGLSWTYSGSLGKAVVTDEAEMDGGLHYTISYGDTLGNIAWQEKYGLLQGQLYWLEFAPEIPFLPAVSFEPPIEISPISGRIGFRKTTEVLETRKDSANTTLRMRVDYEIESIEQVAVAAGTFPNCIRMRMSLAYLDPTDVPLMAGSNTYWFAKGVGIVKYIFPSGSGELLNAERRLGNLP